MTINQKYSRLFIIRRIWKYRRDFDVRQERWIYGKFVLAVRIGYIPKFRDKLLHGANGTRLFPFLLWDWVLSPGFYGLDIQECSCDH